MSPVRETVLSDTLQDSDTTADVQPRVRKATHQGFDSSGAFSVRVAGTFFAVCLPSAVLRLVS